MTGADSTEVTPDWLRLRETADQQARARKLLDPLRDHLPDGRPLVIRDVGCGTGAMGRWLASRLTGPQRWILHDRDPELLSRAVADSSGLRDADGLPVVIHPREGDITQPRPDDLTGTHLVTASALLDLLTHAEVDGLAAACVGAGCPALLTLTVVGRVEIDPPDPLDAELAAAFNAHQRRTVDGRQLLGPDAVEAARDAFHRRDATVHIEPSRWRLGQDQATLAASWLRGWLGSACEQRPDLAGRAGDSLRRRLAACAAGEARIVVEHHDLLALPALPGTPP